MTGRARKINTDERKLAASLFNHVWDLMEKKNRTIEENDRMIHAAHASRYHWANGEPVNLARGEWQVSRVYSIQGRSEPALYHARRSLQICKDNRIGDFDLAFAYEAIARASASRATEQTEPSTTRKRWMPQTASERKTTAHSS